MVDKQFILFHNLIQQNLKIIIKIMKEVIIKKIYYLVEEKPYQELLTL
jgi:hypothetical protein